MRRHYSHAPKSATGDVGDGRLYRFVYEDAEDLRAGELQVAEVLGGGPEGAVESRPVLDPSGVSEATWYQVAASTAMLTILYDAARSSTPIVTRVDNLTVTPAGDVVVGEDGGDMQVVAISAARTAPTFSG